MEELIGDKAVNVERAVSGVNFFKGQEDRKISPEMSVKIVEAARALMNGMGLDPHSHLPHSPLLSFDFNLKEDTPKPQWLEEVSLLAEFDIFDVSNIQFSKAKSGERFLLTEASSGELCVLFNVLAIAGAISDNSLIIVDEPELSLHPEWQRDFLPLIGEIFSSYVGCHFLVATHSPEFASTLPPDNSFVVNLESASPKAFSGGPLTEKSADYQLAWTFRSPGHRNERLLTEIVEVLTALSEGRALKGALLEKSEKLISMKPLVPPNDPVERLLETLEEAMRVLKK